MSHSHAQIVAWLLPLVAPVPVDRRDAEHHRVVDERLEALNAAAQCGLEGLVAVEAAMTAIRLKPGEAPPALTGAQLIAEEVHRARTEKGFTVEHDAEIYGKYVHRSYELAEAGSTFAWQASRGWLKDAINYPESCPHEDLWPWSDLAFKPTNPVDDLVKAGAFIAMQLDLLKYLEAQATT